MHHLRENTIYTRSGTLFSRSLFLSETFKKTFVPKVLFLFDSKNAVKSSLGALSYFLGETVSSIETDGELLDFLEKKSAFAIATTGVFDAGVRIEYKKSKFAVTLSRTKEYVMAEFLEKLLTLGYTHSPHLSKNSTYRLD